MNNKLIGAALLAAAACSDIATSPQANLNQRTNHSALYAEEGEQSPPAGAGEEFQMPTILYDVISDAGWVSGYAFAQSIVVYFATNAIARATVKSSSGENAAESETYDLIPAYRDHGASVNLAMDACTGRIDGIAFGRIWNQFPFVGSMVWGQKSDTRQKDYRCPSQPIGGGGGGSSPTETYICTDQTIDHYWYYPDTGEWEFRYSEYTTVCQPATI